MLPENRLKRNLEIKRAKQKTPLNWNALKEGRHCVVPFYYPFLLIEKHFSETPPTSIFSTLPNLTTIQRVEAYFAVGPKSLSVTLTLASSSVSLVVSNNQSHDCTGVTPQNPYHFCSGHILGRSTIWKLNKTFYIYSKENRILFVFAKQK